MRRCFIHCCLLLVLLAANLITSPASAHVYPQNCIKAQKLEGQVYIGEQVYLSRGLHRAEWDYTYEFTVGAVDIQLSYFGARYLEHAYPPRFITPDPTLSANFDLMNPQSFNLYTYCLNNPINRIDPDGLDSGDANYRRNKWGGAIQMGVAEFWIGMIDIAEDAAKWVADITPLGPGKAKITGTNFSGKEYTDEQANLELGLSVLPFAAGSMKILKKLSKKIHLGQQGKHIPGHRNFIPGRSPLAKGIDAQKLLDGVHSGQYQTVRMTPKNQPVVDFGTTIGSYDGKSTRYGIIHSGKKGAHIVPANPEQY